METRRITKEEKDEITRANMRVFVARNPEYYPCSANSAKLLSLWESQVGCSEDEWNYPVSCDEIQFCYDYIMQHDWLYQRPVEEVDTSAQDAEQRRQQTVRDDHAAQLKAKEIARAKSIPLSQLGAEIGQQNAQFREARDQNLLTTRPTGTESRLLSTVTLGLKAQARATVALANPTLPRDGAEFSKKYAEELRRLRSE